METVLFLLVNLLSLTFDSCQDATIQLYQGAKIADHQTFSWAEQWQMNYCYRRNDLEFPPTERRLGGDRVWFPSPHAYGEAPEESDAIVLFDDQGRYDPHSYTSVATRR